MYLHSKLILVGLLISTGSAYGSQFNVQCGQPSTNQEYSTRIDGQIQVADVVQGNGNNAVARLRVVMYDSRGFGQGVFLNRTLVVQGRFKAGSNPHFFADYGQTNPLTGIIINGLVISLTGNSTGRVSLFTVGSYPRYSDIICGIW